MQYEWNLADGYPAEKNGMRVFSCFSCGGGSTMGYKLAGYEVIGCCEIDPAMIDVYKKNHNPRFPFLSDVRKLREIPLPDELFALDILDGSPPCSTFSMAGRREADWGRKKAFREGQAQQTLDDLFFHFIDLAERLQPKIVVSENVKGILAGNAKIYVRRIIEDFKRAGYDTQIFLLNGATMGLPQMRERVFFVSRRKDLQLPELVLDFKEKPIPFGEISDNTDTHRDKMTPLMERYWNEAKAGESVGKFKALKKLDPIRPMNTIVAGTRHYHYKFKRVTNDRELCLGGSWPLDYDFNGQDANYLIGMSVPPLMMGKLAEQIYKQQLSKIGGSR